MNSLIILPTECVDPTTGILTGGRAVYAFETHGVREGQTIKVAILGGCKGVGLIASATREQVEIRISSDSIPSACYPIDLIVGISRPQTVKKVLQAAAILGARSLHFVKSEHGEKSYLQSQALAADQVQFEVIKGLEQVWEAIPPQVIVHRNLAYFIEHHLQSLGSGEIEEGDCVRLIAHPGGRELASVLPEKTKEGRYPAVVVSIGPERGWSDSEVHEFIKGGFIQIGLGPRVMRVELATVFLFGQLHALLGAPVTT